jgi:predicted lipoprotein with Yx(FWY)xxD motif
MRKCVTAVMVCGGLLAATAMSVPAWSADANPPWAPVEISVYQMDSGAFAFVNDNGLPFFTNDRDAGAKVNCGDECVGLTWLPLYSFEGAMPKGDWTIVRRADKAPQWAFKGKAVYNYVGEGSRDEVLELAKKDGHWHPVSP